MSAPRNSTWWRHDADMTTELRFAKLRDLLKSDPYGLICRLYDLAASVRQDGDVSQIDVGALAQRLEFKGNGKRLLKMLTDSGYLGSDGIIVDWNEKLFRFYAAIRDQNRERGLKSAALRAQAKAATHTDSTEQNKTHTGKRPVERPVETLVDEWVSLPPVLDTVAFKNAWSLWQQYRREQKMPSLKSTSTSVQWSKFAEWGHDAAITAINESIRQGWQGVFPSKANSASVVRPDAPLKVPELAPGDAEVIGRVS